MKTRVGTFSKREIAREISRMPYYQAHFTQKSIMHMLTRGEIDSATIEDAAAAIIKKIAKYGKAF